MYVTKLKRLNLILFCFLFNFLISLTAAECLLEVMEKRYLCQTISLEKKRIDASIEKFKVYSIDKQFRLFRQLYLSMKTQDADYPIKFANSDYLLLMLLKASRFDIIENVVYRLPLVYRRDYWKFLANVVMQTEIIESGQTKLTNMLKKVFVKWIKFYKLKPPIELAIFHEEPKKYLKSYIDESLQSQFLVGIDVAEACLILFVICNDEDSQYLKSLLSSSKPFHQEIAPRLGFSQLTLGKILKTSLNNNVIEKKFFHLIGKYYEMKTSDGNMKRSNVFR